MGTHTRAQGDIILPVCIEDGGYLSEGGHELIDLACKALGGTKGEVSAFYTYWRQRLAITNLRSSSNVPPTAQEHISL